MERVLFIKRRKKESNRKLYLEFIFRRNRSWVEGSPDIFSIGQLGGTQGDVEDLPKLGAIIFKKSWKILGTTKEGLKKYLGGEKRKFWEVIVSLKAGASKIV